MTKRLAFAALIVVMCMVSAVTAVLIMAFGYAALDTL